MTRIAALSAVVFGTLVLAGCQSARLDGLSTQPAPAPLPAAPAGTVQQGTLPPVGTAPLPGTVAPGSTVVGGAQFPAAPVDPTAPGLPTTTTTPPAGTQTAAAGGGAAVSRDAMVGAWKVTTSGASCQMFMALTQWSGGFRAASRGCPGDAASVSAWQVNGSQVVLRDSGGNTVATLFSSGGSRFDGQTKSGQPISLSR
jgi:hypothetical protein